MNDDEGALAFNQEWFLMLDGARRQTGHAPPSAEFPFVFRLRGRWNRCHLEEALHSIAVRHGVLRTAYAPTNRYPPSLHETLLQVFARKGVFIPGTFVRRTLSNPEIAIVERDARTASVDDIVANAMAEPLDPLRPPIRAMVYHVDSDARVLVLVASHLICDGWSIRVLLRDFVSTYRAIAVGAAADLPPIGVDYGQFADAQHRAYRSGAFASAEAFWRRKWVELNGAEIRHAEVPFARHGALPAVPVMAGGLLWLTAAASAAIRDMARRLRLTPYVVFRTAMTLALFATVRKRRIAYWANFANRRPGLEHLVGWCSNTHIVTVDVLEGGNVTALCHQMATAIRDAERHQAMPLASLWQRLGANLDPHDTRVNFDMWPAHRPLAGRPSGPIEVLVSSSLPRMDLDVRALDDGDRFGLRSTHDESRYEAAGVAAFVRQTAAIAAHIATSPLETPLACVRATAEHPPVSCLATP